MTPADVFTAAKVRLESETPIPWFEWFLPDEEDLIGVDPYGVLALHGPFETDGEDHSLLGIEDQPLETVLLVGLVSTTPDALNVLSGQVLTALRGWSAGPGVSAMWTDWARGYVPADSKHQPTQIAWNMHFRFRTGL